MKPPQHSTSSLLDSAVDLLFEIYVLRGNCSRAVKELTNRGGGEELAIEDCARLDDSLAKAYRTLQSSIRTIQASRSRRRVAGL